MKTYHPLERHLCNLAYWLCALCGAAAISARAGSPAVVTNVVGAQQNGTQLVSINYTISDPNSTNVNVYVKVSRDSGATWTVPAFTFTGAYGTNIPVSPTPTGKSIVWNAGADWPGNYTTNCRVRIIANDEGMLLIPGGTYMRGNVISLIGKQDLDITDAPPTTVTVSGFLVDPTQVTSGLWSFVVQAYAQGHGYAFDNSTPYALGSYPMQGANWYDAVKWCNARSEMEGATPAYYTDAGFTNVYRSGDAVPYVNLTANGYRLPTEAEWEVAARGGLKNHRFPWGDTISQLQANYYTCPTNKCTPPPYDLGSFSNYIGSTTLVGSYPPNAYGLFDMAGNVSEWCWDWYDPNYYNVAPASNPQGPATGTARVYRGGSYADTANILRTAYRGNGDPIQAAGVTIGFRCVRAF